MCSAPGPGQCWYCLYILCSISSMTSIFMLFYTNSALTFFCHGALTLLHSQMSSDVLWWPLTSCQPYHQLHLGFYGLHCFCFTCWFGACAQSVLFDGVLSGATCAPPLIQQPPKPILISAAPRPDPAGLSSTLKGFWFLSSCTYMIRDA